MVVVVELCVLIYTDTCVCLLLCLCVYLSLLNSGVLSLLYGFVDICFVLLINRYRKSAIGMQYFLLVVLLLATGAWVDSPSGVLIFAELCT